MIMCKKYLLFIFGVICISHFTTYSQKIDRNLKNYEKGPFLEILVYADEDLREIARQFLWKNWTEKKLAYFQIKYVTIEGATQPCSYFIEKDKKNEWLLNKECDQRELCPYISDKDCERHRYKKNSYYDIKQVAMKNGKSVLNLFERKKNKGEVF